MYRKLSAPAFLRRFESPYRIDLPSGLFKFANTNVPSKILAALDVTFIFGLSRSTIFRIMIMLGMKL